MRGVANWNADNLPAVDVDPNESVHDRRAVLIASALASAYSDSIATLSSSAGSLDLQAPAAPLVVGKQVTSVVHDWDGDHEAVT